MDEDKDDKAPATEKESGGQEVTVGVPPLNLNLTVEKPG